MVHNTQPAGPRPRGCAFTRSVRKTSLPSAQAPNNIPGYSRARFSRTVLAFARKTGADGRKPPCEISFPRWLARRFSREALFARV
jgi:hypothetical protein